MATKQVEVTPEAAAQLSKPIEEAQRRDYFKRVCDLEYTLIKTRDALAVIARGLEDFANSHASPEEMTLTQADVSLIFGAVNLLESVSAECGRAYWKGVRDE